MERRSDQLHFEALDLLKITILRIERDTLGHGCRRNPKVVVFDGVSTFFHAGRNLRKGLSGLRVDRKCLMAALNTLERVEAARSLADVGRKMHAYRELGDRHDGDRALIWKLVNLDFPTSFKCDQDRCIE